MAYDISKKNVPLRHNAWQFWEFKSFYTPLGAHVHPILLEAVPETDADLMSLWREEVLAYPRFHFWGYKFIAYPCNELHVLHLCYHILKFTKLPAYLPHAVNCIRFCFWRCL